MVLTIGVNYSGAVTEVSLAVAAIAGIALNAVLPGKDYEFGEDEKGDTSVNFRSEANLKVGYREPKKRLNPDKGPCAAE